MLTPCPIAVLESQRPGTTVYLHEDIAVESPADSEIDFAPRLADARLPLKGRRAEFSQIRKTMHEASTVPRGTAKTHAASCLPTSALVIEGHGEAVFAKACELDLEGIVGKQERLAVPARTIELLA